MKPLRRRMQMIFQDPYASLNPRMTVYDALAEPMLFHGLADKKSVQSDVLHLMDDVGLARSAVKKYPHEFSGGQRQRIAIGRAIDLSVVRKLCDRVMVLQHGKLLETGDTESLWSAPQHDYTKQLLSSIALV